MSVHEHIAEHPERTRVEFHEGLVKWASVIDGIGKLLAMAESVVSLEEKRQLLDDLKIAQMNGVACVNGMQQCEIVAAQACAKLNEKWGWLL